MRADASGRRRPMRERDELDERSVRVLVVAAVIAAEWSMRWRSTCWWCSSPNARPSVPGSVVWSCPDCGATFGPVRLAL